MEPTAGRYTSARGSRVGRALEALMAILAERRAGGDPHPGEAVAAPNRAGRGAVGR